jgi:hypothetical protein
MITFIKVFGLILPVVASIVGALVAAPDIKGVRDRTGDDSFLTYILSGAFLRKYK